MRKTIIRIIYESKFICATLTHMPEHVPCGAVNLHDCLCVSCRNQIVSVTKRCDVIHMKVIVGPHGPVFYWRYT